MAIFDSIKLFKPKRNKFDLSHGRKFSFNFGELVPVMVQEVVPGDKYNVQTGAMMRTTPLVHPVMHEINAYIYNFFVPNRLVWNEWEDFITGGRLGTSNPVMPYVVLNDTTKDRFTVGKLPDFFGIPPILDTGPMISQQLQLNALPFRAYQLIWNEYFRDQNLSVPVPFTKGSGDVTSEAALLLSMRLKCFEKDYFTSCLPFAQRGGAVELPIEGVATSESGDLTTSDIRASSGGGLANSGDLKSVLGVEKVAGDPDQDVYHDVIGEAPVEAGVSINDLRRSIRLQEWLEKQARGGARYIETILSHFGVRSSDARLQRPEFLGGGKTRVAISEVLSTVEFSSEGGPVPQGNMAGHAIGVGGAQGFVKEFEEHGFVISLMCALPRTAYQNGVPRDFLRFDKFDYYWPEFANIGEQAVYDGEIFYDPYGAADQILGTFGYQSRYAEYKYKPDTVHGTFRTTEATWHAGRIFAEPPALNTDFVDVDHADFNRIFAVQGSDVKNLYCQVYHKFNALRPMPYYGVPSI